MNFFRKVWTNKSNGQKLISIPSKENIKDGEWIMVSKIDPKVFAPTKNLKQFKLKEMNNGK